MSSFGEELRAARLSRGVALEDITEVTKISQRHLIALEQNRFRTLPGGILTKGIVRGYVGAAGLDVKDWTDRFAKAYAASGDAPAEDEDWTAFASNVGKKRIAQREAAEMRLRWAGVIVLMLAAVVTAFLTVRYFGIRAGWWDSMIPLHTVSAKTHAFVLHSASFFSR